MWSPPGVYLNRGSRKIRIGKRVYVFAQQSCNRSSNLSAWANAMYHILGLDCWMGAMWSLIVRPSLMSASCVAGKEVFEHVLCRHWARYSSIPTIPFVMRMHYTLLLNWITIQDWCPWEPQGDQDEDYSSTSLTAIYSVNDLLSKHCSMWVFHRMICKRTPDSLRQASICFVHYKI